MVHFDGQRIRIEALRGFYRRTLQVHGLGEQADEDVFQAVLAELRRAHHLMEPRSLPRHVPSPLPSVHDDIEDLRVLQRAQRSPRRYLSPPTQNDGEADDDNLSVSKRTLLGLRRRSRAGFAARASTYDEQVPDENNPFLRRLDRPAATMDFVDRAVARQVEEDEEDDQDDQDDDSEEVYRGGRSSHNETIGAFRRDDQADLDGWNPGGKIEVWPTTVFLEEDADEDEDGPGYDENWPDNDPEPLRVPHSSPVDMPTLPAFSPPGPRRQVRPQELLRRQQRFQQLPLLLRRDPVTCDWLRRARAAQYGGPDPDHPDFLRADYEWTDESDDVDDYRTVICAHLADARNSHIDRMDDDAHAFEMAQRRADSRIERNPYSPTLHRTIPLPPMPPPDVCIDADQRGTRRLSQSPAARMHRQWQMVERYEALVAEAAAPPPSREAGSDSASRGLSASQQVSGSTEALVTVIRRRRRSFTDQLEEAFDEREQSNKRRRLS